MRWQVKVPDVAAGSWQAHVPGPSLHPWPQLTPTCVLFTQPVPCFWETDEALNETIAPALLMIQLTALEIIAHSWCGLMYLACLSSNFSLACQCTCGINESIEESNRTDTPQISIHLTLKNITGSVALSSQIYFFFFFLKLDWKIHSPRTFWLGGMWSGACQV